MNQHKAIVYGAKKRKIYYNHRYSTTIDEKYETIELINLFEGFIDNPPIDVGEKIFISNKKKSVKVTDASRNVDGGFVYYTDYSEYIEDDETSKSKEQSEIKSKELKEELEAEWQKEEQEKEKNKKWYQKLFKKSH